MYIDTYIYAYICMYMCILHKCVFVCVCILSGHSNEKSNSPTCHIYITLRIIKNNISNISSLFWFPLELFPAPNTESGSKAGGWDQSGTCKCPLDRSEL